MELIDGQASEATTGAAGGQYMTGSGNIVAQNRGRTLAEKNGTRRMDSRNQRLGVSGHDFAVFRCQSVDERHGRIEVADLDEPGVGVQDFLNEFTAVQSGQLARDLLLHGLQLGGGSGDHPDPFVAGAMLGLSEKICRDEAGVR